MKPKKQLYEQQITGEIIGAAIEVHRELGPGAVRVIIRDVSSTRVGASRNFF